MSETEQEHERHDLLASARILQTRVKVQRQGLQEAEAELETFYQAAMKRLEPWPDAQAQLKALLGKE